MPIVTMMAIHLVHNFTQMLIVFIFCSLPWIFARLINLLSEHHANLLRKFAHNVPAGLFNAFLIPRPPAWLLMFRFMECWKYTAIWLCFYCFFFSWLPFFWTEIGHYGNMSFFALAQEWIKDEGNSKKKEKSKGMSMALLHRSDAQVPWKSR